MSDDRVAIDEHVRVYWLEFYCNGYCTLCGGWGWVDTRGVKTPDGIPVGRINYCICPHGQALRERSMRDEPSHWRLDDAMPVPGWYATLHAWDAENEGSIARATYWTGDRWAEDLPIYAWRGPFPSAETARIDACANGPEQT